MGRPPSDKRARLIDAAVIQFQQRGVASSSLADIAQAAEIAPGNVFYHFATKDALARAVIETWCARIEDFLAEFAEIADPWQRLRAFVASSDSRSADYTTFGCPLAALARDLSGGMLAKEAARPLALQQRWLSDQFGLVGFDPASAAGHANFLLAALQGSYALAVASGDASVITAASTHLRAWLDDVQRVR